MSNIKILTFILYNSVTHIVTSQQIIIHVILQGSLKQKKYSLIDGGQTFPVDGYQEAYVPFSSNIFHSSPRLQIQNYQRLRGLLQFCGFYFQSTLLKICVLFILSQTIGNKPSEIGAHEEPWSFLESSQALESNAVALKHAVLSVARFMTFNK